MFQEVAWLCRGSKLAHFHWFCSATPDVSTFSASEDTGVIPLGCVKPVTPSRAQGSREVNSTNPSDCDRFLKPGMRREGVRVRKQLQTPSPRKPEQDFVG